MNCGSCGMAMEKPHDFGGGRTENKYCIHCCDINGNLKNREEVKKGMMSFFLKSKTKTKEDAEKFVDDYMKKMPAWS